VTFYSAEFHRAGVCACGQVFIGPRVQKRCAECAKAAKPASMARWRKLQKGKKRVSAR
jgi:hypothetical protein